MRSNIRLALAFVAVAVLAASLAPQPTSASPATSPKLAESAQRVFDDSLARYRTGQGTIDEAALWSERIYDADHSQSSLASRAHTLDGEAQSKVASGSATKHDALVAAFLLAEAEARK